MKVLCCYRVWDCVCTIKMASYVASSDINWKADMDAMIISFSFTA
jgi:hypothetical protein